MNEERNYEEVIDETVVDQVELVEDKVEEVKKPKSKGKKILEGFAAFLVICALLNAVSVLFPSTSKSRENELPKDFTPVTYQTDDKSMYVKALGISQVLSKSSSDLENGKYVSTTLENYTGIFKIGKLERGLAYFIPVQDKGRYGIRYTVSGSNPDKSELSTELYVSIDGVIAYEVGKDSDLKQCNLGKGDCPKIARDTYNDMYIMLYNTGIRLNEFGYPTSNQ